MNPYVIEAIVLVLAVVGLFAILLVGWIVVGGYLDAKLGRRERRVPR